MIRTTLATLAILSLWACANTTAPEPAPADTFMATLSAHCGKAYAGRMVSSDEADADFARQAMVMHVRSCTDDEIRVPFHVGEDRSRTWVITRTDEGLRLKHDHRHKDGEEDAVTQYGGDAVMVDTARRVEFPVDQYSIDLFNREGLAASVTNVWAIELTEDMYAYELRRANRHFRVEFDLAEPVAMPPAPWGS